MLELFEEDFNRPAAFVEIADAASGKVHVVGDEDHDLLFAVDDDSCFNSSKPLWLGSSTLQGFQYDLIITQHFALNAGFLELLHDSICHVVLGMRDPRDVFASQFVKMIEVDVGFIEDHDFPRFK